MRHFFTQSRRDALQRARATSIDLTGLHPSTVFIFNRMGI